jgi:hypothetical protein
LEERKPTILDGSLQKKKEKNAGIIKNDGNLEAYYGK